MKICITSTGDGLESAVDPRFGRCPFFIVADTETGEFKALVNPSTQASGGAGIQSAQLVANEGAEAVLTGSVGPNASQALSSFNIRIFVGISGSVKEAIQAYKGNKLKEVTGPTVREHFGRP
jgi:predicted Fe-Mo cluster-binding NifX family protein